MVYCIVVCYVILKMQWYVLLSYGLFSYAVLPCDIAGHIALFYTCFSSVLHYVVSYYTLS